MHALSAPTAVVADDERLMREQIVARLKEAWPELTIVGEAGNGREAVAIVHDLEPDFVFLDVRMPEMDGIQSAQALAGMTHVVFVTAYDEYAVSAFEQGAVDYLLKPAEPERVALTCQRLRERLQHKPAPMDDLLAQLSQRLGGDGVKPREFLRWVQASVGARLNSITPQQSVASSQQVQLQQSISTLQSLDYASAITTLDQQNTTLSAAMQAFTLTQGLSLVKYMQ